MFYEHFLKKIIRECVASKDRFYTIQNTINCVIFTQMSTNALLPLPSVMSMLNVWTLVGLIAADAKLVILEAEKLAKVCVEVAAIKQLLQWDKNKQQ